MTTTDPQFNPSLWRIAGFLAAVFAGLQKLPNITPEVSTILTILIIIDGAFMAFLFNLPNSLSIVSRVVASFRHK